MNNQSSISQEPNIPKILGATAADKVVYCLARAYPKDLHKDDIQDQCDQNVYQKLIALKQEGVLCSSGRGRYKLINLGRYKGAHNPDILLRMFEKGYINASGLPNLGAPVTPYSLTLSESESNPKENGENELTKAVRAFLNNTDKNVASFHGLLEDLQHWLESVESERTRLEQAFNCFDS